MIGSSNSDVYIGLVFFKILLKGVVKMVRALSPAIETCFQKKKKVPLPKRKRYILSKLNTLKKEKKKTFSKSRQQSFGGSKKKDVVVGRRRLRNGEKAALSRDGGGMNRRGRWIISPRIVSKYSGKKITIGELVSIQTRGPFDDGSQESHQIYVFAVLPPPPPLAKKIFTSL